MIYPKHAQLSLVREINSGEFLSFKVPKDRYNLSVTYSGSKKRNIPISYMVTPDVTNDTLEDEVVVGSQDPGVVTLTVMTTALRVDFAYDLVLSEDMTDIVSLGCIGRLIMAPGSKVVTKNLGLHYGCDFSRNGRNSEPEILGADCYRGSFKSASSFGFNEFELSNNMCYTVYEKCQITEEVKKEYYYNTSQPGVVSMRLNFSTEEYLPAGTVSVFVKTTITGVPQEINRYMFDVKIPATPSQNPVNIDLGSPVKFKISHYLSDEQRKDKETWTKLTLDVVNNTGEPCTVVIDYHHPRSIRKIEDDPTEAEQAGLITGSKVSWCYQYDYSQSVDLFIL